MRNYRRKFPISHLLTSAVAIVLYNLILAATVIKSMAGKLQHTMNIHVAQIVREIFLELKCLFNIFWSHRDLSGIGISPLH